MTKMEGSKCQGRDTEQKLEITEEISGQRVGRTVFQTERAAELRGNGSHPV